MELPKSFPFLTDEQYEQSLKELKVWQVHWPKRFAGTGPQKIYIVSKDERARWNDVSGSLNKVEKPDRLLMATLRGLLISDTRATQVVVLAKEGAGIGDGVMLPLWWET
jgi:hypothetical protein